MSTVDLSLPTLEHWTTSSLVSKTESNSMLVNVGSSRGRCAKR